MGSEHYCLRWNNHQSNLLGVFSQLLQDESLVDVTLACSEGASIRAHKVVLSACSSYFQSLFLDHPSRHPIVILKDVQFAELRTLVEFMYKGEVNVQYCQLSALLKTAESLKVKGLAEMTNLNSGAETSEVGGSEVDPFQPQDLTPSRASTDQQSERLTREETSPPRASPLMHIRRPRHDFRYELMKHEPRHEQKYESRHEQKFETRTEQQKQDSRHESRQEAIAHEARPEPDSDPGGKETRQESRQDTRSESRQHEVKHEPPQDQTTRDPGGKEEPPDEPMWTSSPDDEMSSVHSNCGNSDNLGLNMSINMNNNTPTMLTPNPLELRLGLGSLRSISGEPIPGPSGLPPVQQVPLSLKKEVDWNRLPEDKSGGESSSDYRHPLQEPESFDSGGDGRVYPCMYCGVGFPHQSKLTRHILSHSLETLKYRDAVMSRTLPPLPLAGSVPSGGVGIMGMDESPLDVELVSVEPGGNVVLCKFCGKSFPDVGSLIAHLPAHTGDRPFKCEFCGKAFKLRHHMKDHCRVHTGERPFRCSLCGKTFSRSTILKAHEKTHYPKYVRKFLSPSPLDTEEESPH